MASLRSWAAKLSTASRVSLRLELMLVEPSMRMKSSWAGRWVGSSTCWVARLVRFWSVIGVPFIERMIVHVLEPLTSEATGAVIGDDDGGPSVVEDGPLVVILFVPYLVDVVAGSGHYRYLLLACWRRKS